MQRPAITGAVSPALSTVNSNDSECLPGEAVDVMAQLVQHNGSLEDLCPPVPDATGRLVQRACDEKFNASVLISRYAQSHSAFRNAELFNHVAQLFGI